MPERAIVLIDGEHYPPITRTMLEHIRASGREVVGAVFLGGIEKWTGEPILESVPTVSAHGLRDLVEALARFHPDVAIDLSDEPVVSTTDRLRFASVLMAEDVAYEGEGFRFDPPRAPSDLTSRHSISVIGSGKRTGKTAVCAALARHAALRGMTPLIVAMGRGGPPEPVVTYGTDSPPSVADLVAKADAGEHAATDAYEDAIVARCTTIGARRGGAGLSGAPLVHTVHDALKVAEGELHDVLLLEGSGTAIPPARTDKTLYVVGANTTIRDLFAGLMPSRLLVADAIVCTGVDAPESIRDPELTFALRERMISELGTYPDLVETVFRPHPLEDISDRRVLLATTAPEWTGPGLRAKLEEEHGAKVVGIVHHLSNRPALEEALSVAEGTYDVLLTEIKGAGLDVAARRALAAGAHVVLCDNVPVPASHEDPQALARLFDAALES